MVEMKLETALARVIAEGRVRTYDMRGKDRHLPFLVTARISMKIEPCGKDVKTSIVML
jgi:hypothetical protein